jgi:hypothetical protein
VHRVEVPGAGQAVGALHGNHSIGDGSPTVRG